MRTGTILPIRLRGGKLAALFYRILRGAGYVALRGRATIVDDPVAKEQRWRPHWEPPYQDPDAEYVLTLRT